MTIDGRRLALLHSSVIASAPGTAPGTIVRAWGDDLHIAAGDGVVAITRLKPEGRRPMSVRDWLNGVAVTPGTTVT